MGNIDLTQPDDGNGQTEAEHSGHKTAEPAEVSNPAEQEPDLVKSDDPY
jgi:hypothetical protein